MSYNEELQNKNILKLRKMLDELPDYCSDFFRGIENVTSHRTRLAYAYDLTLFFNYLKEKGYSVDRFEILNLLTVSDLEKYIEYLNYFVVEKNGVKQVHKNNEKGKSRKIASLRTFFKYFYKKQKISSNPASLIDMPKIHSKEIVRLEVDEVAKLLDTIEKETPVSKIEKFYHEKTKARDLALVILLLGTGMRVSECVGIDIKDIDFKQSGIKITRKGGNESIVYFGDEVKKYLLEYLEERVKILTNTDALFLSLQKTRITVRTVQNLVKKYSKKVTTLKNISPHKLRSTYGTNLYKETGDIYLVADVLGHKDVNTTRKHYAHLDDEHRKKAAKVIKLRDV